MTLSTKTGISPGQMDTTATINKVNVLLSELDKHLSEENPKCSHSIFELLSEWRRLVS